jgi:tRNA (uracil-5-)-methyltransferase
VVAVELDARLCAAAERNLAANGIANARVVRAPSARFAAATLRRRRLRLADPTPTEPPPAAAVAPPGEAGEEVEFDCVLVDPPRAGLDAETRGLVGRFAHVLYVSCCPAALARDLAAWRDTHRIVRAAAFDHFPHTAHVECAVYLRAVGGV